MKLSSARRPAVIGTATVAVLALAFTGTSVAKDLIGSGDIKDNSIRSVDVRNNALKGEDIAADAVGSSEIRSGAVGSSEVANGSLGAGDLSGSAVRGIQAGVFVGENWGVNLRNTQGTAMAMLRSGPFTTNFGNSTKPPFGSGSLMLQSAGSGSKVDFGNEVTYSGKNLVSALGGNVGFSVFTTGENEGRADKNLPVVRMEIDPNLGGSDSNYATMVFVPNKEPDAGKWTSYNQVDGQWYLTGNGSGQPGEVSGCKLSSPCSFSILMGKLGSATIHSVSIGTNGTGGPDFVGAVDAFRIGNTVYDFEARGVIARNA